MRACLHSKGRRRRRNQRLSSSAAVWTVAIRRMGASARRSSIANPARGSRRSRRASWPPPGRQAWQSPSSADCRNDRHDRSDFVCLESDPFHPNVSSPKTPEVDRRRSDLSFKHHAEVKAFHWTKSRRGQLLAGRRLLLVARCTSGPRSSSRATRKASRAEPPPAPQGHGAFLHDRSRHGAICGMDSGKRATVRADVMT